MFNGLLSPDAGTNKEMLAIMVRFFGKLLFPDSKLMRLEHAEDCFRTQRMWVKLSMFRRFLLDLTLRARDIHLKEEVRADLCHVRQVFNDPIRITRMVEHIEANHQIGNPIEKMADFFRWAIALLDSARREVREYRAITTN